MYKIDKEYKNVKTKTTFYCYALSSLWVALCEITKIKKYLLYINSKIKVE